LKARELEPLSPNVHTNVAWTYFVERRYGEAERELSRALELDPDALYPLWASGLNLQLMGEHDRSVAAFEKAVALTERAQTFYVALLGGAYGAAGRTAEARRVLEELRERSTREYVAPYHLAFVHVALGEDEAAIAALNAAYEERNALAWWPRSSPVFDPLRSNPRFQRVLEKIVPA
jgi:tetratricopeptide (TPR) repeat protein